MKNFQDLLAEALALNSIFLSDKIQMKLVQYLYLLQTWNAIYNLTSITNPKDMVYLHIIDSLCAEPFLHGKRVLDVGTGAGLPGIPLALIAPDKKFTLLDKSGKKTRFVTQVVAELMIHNVEIINERSEYFHPVDCFDTIISRAYASLSLFIETTEHLICPKGIFIAMKGKYPQDEIYNLSKDYALQKASQVDIQGISVERHILCLSKK